jgi:hypothetical protein
VPRYACPAAAIDLIELSKSVLAFPVRYLLIVAKSACLGSRLAAVTSLPSPM